MAARKRGLGRGLDALLGGASEPAKQAHTQASSEKTLDTLAVDKMQRGRYQPRSIMKEDALLELAESIKAQGLVQPIVVRPVSEGKYEIIAGERRWRAAQMAGLHEVPVVVRDVPDQAAMAMALIENIQREDLNPLEEATALNRLLDEFGLTHSQIAEAVGKSRATVTNLLRLMTLNSDVKTRLENSELDMGHARALLALDGTAQSAAARQVAEQKLSVRATEQLVKRLLSPEPVAPKPQADPNVVRLQQELTDKLGAKVRLQCSDVGRGKVTIDFHSLDELDGILERIQ